MLQGFYEKSFYVAVSQCDPTEKMTFPAVFTLFQDIAGEHAKLLGIGGMDLKKKGLFWLTVRTRVRILAMPSLEDKVTVRTWLGAEEGRSLRSERYYLLKNEAGETLAEGKTEWGVFSLAARRLARIMEAGIPAIDRLEDRVCDEAFSHFETTFEEEHPTFLHRVCPSDVDVGSHMNNCAYLWAMYNTFKVQEATKLDPIEVEICFRSPCLPEETVTIHRRQKGNGYEFIFEKADGTIGALSKIICKGE